MSHVGVMHVYMCEGEALEVLLNEMCDIDLLFKVTVDKSYNICAGGYLEDE